MPGLRSTSPARRSLIKRLHLSACEPSGCILRARQEARGVLQGDLRGEKEVSADGRLHGTQRLGRQAHSSGAVEIQHRRVAVSRRDASPKLEVVEKYYFDVGPKSTDSKLQNGQERFGRRIEHKAFSYATRG